MPYDIDEVFSVSYREDIDDAADAFLTQYIPPESHIQMKVALFIKDGKIFQELRKGDKDRKTFYKEILEVVSLLGGDNDDDM